ncbi:prolipoprotein diacylglyceryl transferase [Candidatus Microgenomates bacterium]|nr:prolipoprotein diacylglyceryl transferase [Candidatus Microgenomates bacterium]
MFPILFSLGPISVSSFGFFAAAAFLLACFLIWKFSHEELLFSKTPIEDETLFDAVFIFILASFFGARLIFIFSHFQNFGFNFLSWILVRQASGFYFLGGFIVGCVFLFIFSLRKKLDFWKMADLFSLGITAVLPLCFIGAFLDGVSAGAKTTLPWGILFTGLEGKRHPVQLVGAVFFLLFFLILKKVRFLVLKRREKKGVIVFSFLSFSGLVLFLLDFLKEGEIYLGGLKKDQFLYLTAAIISSVCLYKQLERNFKNDFRAFYQYLKSTKKIKLTLKKKGKK